MTRDWLDTGVYVPAAPLDLMACGPVHDDRDEAVQAEHRFVEAVEHRRWMQRMHRLAEQGLLHTVHAVERESYENNLRVLADKWATP